MALRSSWHADPPPPKWAGLVAITYLLLSLLWRLPDPWWLLSMLTFVPLLYAVRHIDQINRSQGARSPYYRRIRLWQIPLCLLGAAFATFAILSSFNVFPSSQVTEGNRVPSSHQRFLLDHGILQAEDELPYFYSVGLLSIRGDGNVLTDRRVISYYQSPETGELVVESATFDTIADVRARYSRNALDDTVLEISTGEDESFVLYLSAEEQGDRKFTDALLTRWREHKPDATIGTMEP